MQQDNRDNSTGIHVEAKDNSKVNVAKTINIYDSSEPPRGIPFQALALPKDYVDRPEIRQKIKSKLIDCSVSRPGTLVVSAIYGLGGVGKSVMAAALAHDREVQEVCADGVLWVTLGQNPDLLPCLYGWVQALGDYDFNPTTIDSASSHLRSLLRDKKMLLVVDDAWNSDHVAPFQVGGEGCRVLVTTREAHVQDADRIDMDVMSSVEALKLLLGKAQIKSLTMEVQKKAYRLIEVVGGLPLAIDLAGAQILDGVGWDELLVDLGEEIVYLESLDRPNLCGVKDEKMLKRLSLKASLNLSLKLLTIEQLQQFAWLGVLPEDVTIQPEMATTLWSVSLKQAKVILRTFRSKALLLSGVQGVGQDSGYRIHDLMHDLAKGLLIGQGEPGIPGLGLEFNDAHGILLDHYRQQTKDLLWHTLPDDSYIHSNLTWHMEQAGRLDDLHGLFQEVTTEGRNGWFEACEYLGQSARFITDLGRAWKLSEKIYVVNSGANCIESINLQVRYALIFSTVNSLANNIPPKLMAALVKSKKWSPAQGLAYARQAQKSEARSEILQELAAYLSPVFLSEALKMVYEIQSESDKANVLNRLVEYLPENLLLEALKILHRIQSESVKTDVLSKLVEYLPENLLPDALKIACGICSASDKARALCSLLKYLPSIVPYTFEVVCGLQLDSDKEKYLCSLAAHLPESLLIEALQVTRNIKTELYRSRALHGLAVHLPKYLMPELIRIACNISYLPSRVFALSGLDEYLPRELLFEIIEFRSITANKNIEKKVSHKLVSSIPGDFLNILQTIREIESEPSRLSILIEMVANLPKHLMPEALQIAVEIRSEHTRAIALGLLVANLPEDLLSKALYAAIEINSEYSRATALNKIVAHLPEYLLFEVLNVVKDIESKSYRAIVLSGLATYLPGHFLSKALQVANSIDSESSRAIALSGLAIYLPEDLLSEALQATREIKSEYFRLFALSAIANHLPKELSSEALKIARDINSESIRVSALSRLITNFPEAALEALKIARDINSESIRASALSELVAYLPRSLMLETFEIAKDFQDESCRTRALSELVDYLPSYVMSEVLKVARKTHNDFAKAKLMGRLSIYSPEITVETLSVVHGIQSLFDRIRAMCVLAEVIPEIMPEAFEILGGIKSESSRASALSELAVHLPDNLFPEALQITREIKSELSQANVISGLAPYLPHNLFSEALQITNEIKSEPFRAIAISGLAAHLPHNLFSEVLEMAFCIQSESSRADALSVLAAHLPHNLYSEVLEIAFCIQSEYLRAGFFSSAIACIDLEFFDFPFFSEILHTLSNRDRSQFLEDIPKLAPAIIHLSDRSTLNLVVQAMREVCQQWP